MVGLVVTHLIRILLRSLVRALNDLRQDKAANPSDLNELLMTMAEVRAQQNQPDQAIALHKEVLQRMGANLGATHASTLAYESSVALFCERTDRLSDAEAMYRRVFNCRLEALGSNHEDTLTVQFNLALTLRRSLAPAASQEAETLFARVVAEGDTNPDVAPVIVQRARLALAGLYQDSARLTAAEALLWRFLQADETLSLPRCEGLFCLGNLLTESKRASEAEPLFEEALAGRRKLLGPAHADTGRTLNGLASAAFAMGKLATAEAMFNEALEVLRQALGVHPFTLSVLLNASHAAVARGNLLKAEALLQEAVQVLQENAGDDHPATARARKQLQKVQTSIAAAGEIIN